MIQDSEECSVTAFCLFLPTIQFLTFDYGLKKHWNAWKGPCIAVKFNSTWTKSYTWKPFDKHNSSSFENISYHHVLVWPNWIMLSSFCQRLCKSTWGGVLILLPKGFIKYTFYQITFYYKTTCCCQKFIFKWDLKQYQCDSNTFHNYSAESYVFTCQALSHFTVIFQCTALSDSVKLSFWPPYNVFPC